MVQLPLLHACGLLFQNKEVRERVATSVRGLFRRQAAVLLIPLVVNVTQCVSAKWLRWDVHTLLHCSVVLSFVSGCETRSEMHFCSSSPRRMHPLGSPALRAQQENVLAIQLTDTALSSAQHLRGDVSLEGLTRPACASSSSLQHSTQRMKAQKLLSTLRTDSCGCMQFCLPRQPSGAPQALPCLTAEAPPRQGGPLKDHGIRNCSGCRPAVSDTLIRQVFGRVVFCEETVHVARAVSPCGGRRRDADQKAVLKTRRFHR